MVVSMASFDASFQNSSKLTGSVNYHKIGGGQWSEERTCVERSRSDRIIIAQTICIDHSTTSQFNSIGSYHCYYWQRWRCRQWNSSGDITGWCNNRQFGQSKLRDITRWPQLGISLRQCNVDIHLISKWRLGYRDKQVWGPSWGMAIPQMTYEARDITRKLHLISWLMSLWVIDDGNIEQYLRKFKMIQSQLISIGQTLLEEDIIEILFNTLPDFYESFIIALNGTW